MFLFAILSSYHETGRRVLRAVVAPLGVLGRRWEAPQALVIVGRASGRRAQRRLHDLGKSADIEAKLSVQETV